MSRYKRYQFVYQISWKRLRAFRSSKLLLNERKEKELYVFLRSSAKTGAARSKSETLNRALLSSFLAEFSDFEGMLGLYTCNTDSSSPPFLPPPPPQPTSPATIATPISWLSPRSLRCPAAAADVRVGVNADRARVNRASYNIRGPGVGESVGVGMSVAWACVLYSSRRYHFHGNF